MKLDYIYRGDCREVLKASIDEGSISLVFADPPYNLSGNGLKWEGNTTGGDWYMINEEWDKMTESDYLKFTTDWINGCSRVLKNNGSIYISCTFHNIAEVMMVLKLSDFDIKNVLTWQKTNAMPNMTRRVFTHSTEFIIWAVKGKGWVFNYEELKKINPERQKNGELKQMRDVWPMPLVQGKERLRDKDGRALHPTQKPEEMLKRIIIASSNKGDVVLDPFVGSGTTAFVAKKLGRKWLGIDNSEKYIEATCERLKSLSDNKKVKLNKSKKLDKKRKAIVG